MAIKVNGTSVITDARALNNITSVDSTTVTAMSNAGVGGATTLLTDRASVGTGSQVEVSFTGGYRRYEVFFEDITVSTNSDFYLRCKNSSNATISSSNAYYWCIGSNRQTFNSNLGTEVRIASYQISTSSGSSNDARFTVYDPYSTDGTFFVTWNHGFTDGSTGIRDVGGGNGGLYANNVGRQRANAAVFFLNGGNFTGGKYSVWGVSN